MDLLTGQKASPYDRWGKGPNPSSDWFPIGVWMQDPADAPLYKEAGINFYCALWQGPTEQQLAELQAHDMRVIAAQNEVGLRHIDNPIIMGWMQPDEPDNAQRRPEGGYGPPVHPDVVRQNYEAMTANDPSRPVFLNLGQGVADDTWKGRGPNASLDDYPQYCQGGDIVSFDIYPVASLGRTRGDDPLWYVAKGLERLRQWCGPGKVIWNILETGNIYSNRRATPHQLRAQVWMSLIHGSTGIIYFVHSFRPTTNPRALLEDPEMLSAVTAINGEIRSLAPVLNSPSVNHAVRVASSNAAVPVAHMVKQMRTATYVFAVAMRPGQTSVTFDLHNLGVSRVEVIGEERTLPVVNGVFTDDFSVYDVRMYRLIRSEGVDPSDSP